MGSSAEVAAIERLIAGPPVRLYVVAAGAGATLQSRLWAVPGVSSVLVGGAFPYDTGSIDEFLGYAPERYVTAEVAANFAQTAYRKALLSKREGEPIGIGITASVAGNRVHRGLHQAFVSIASRRQQLTARILLKKGLGYEDRQRDEDAIVSLALACLFGEAGVKDTNPFPIPYDVGETEEGTWRWVESGKLPSPAELLLEHPFFHSDGLRGPAPKDGRGLLLVPGTFDPLHFGHIAMAEEAASKSGLQPVFMLTMKPPHKEPISFSQALDRIAQFRSRDFLLDEGNALYIEKARAYPGAAFAIGADTLDRILDPKWGNVIDQVDEFLRLGTRFFVADRTVNGKVFDFWEIRERRSKEIWPSGLQTLPLGTMFELLHGTWNVSSTELRAAT